MIFVINRRPAALCKFVVPSAARRWVHENQNPRLQALGVGFGETHSSGAFRLSAFTACGNCACGPSIRVGDVVHGREAADLQGLLQTGVRLRFLLILQDTTAVAVGADRVVAAFNSAEAMGLSLRLSAMAPVVPLVLSHWLKSEWACIAFGAVKVSDVPSIIESLRPVQNHEVSWSNHRDPVV